MFDPISTLINFNMQTYDPDGRYPYIVGGIITNISDDQNLCRVKARLFHMNAGEETDWLSPALPGSMEATPNVSDTVLVLFLNGNPNNGIYLTTSSPNKRPTEWLILGMTFAAMYNDLVSKFNSLTTTYTSHTHPVSGAATTAPNQPYTLGSAGKIKDPNGASVSPKSGDQIALSGKVKTR